MIEIWHGEGNDAFCYLNVPDRPAGRPADQLCSWLAARSCRWVRTLFSEMLDRSSRMASLMASSQALVISEWESPTARGTRFDQFKSAGAIIAKRLRSSSSTCASSGVAYRITSSKRRKSAVSSEAPWFRSDEHTSELQSQSNLVCRLLLEKKKNNNVQP